MENNNNKIAVIYYIGIYISLFIIVIAVCMLFFSKNDIQDHYLISFNVHQLLENISKLNPYYLIYLSIIILVLTPIIVIVFLCITYLIKKEFYLFFISFILISTILLVILLKG